MPYDQTLTGVCDRCLVIGFRCHVLVALSMYLQSGSLGNPSHALSVAYCLLLMYKQGINPNLPASLHSILLKLTLNGMP